MLRSRWSLLRPLLAVAVVVAGLVGVTSSAGADGPDFVVIAGDGTGANTGDGGPASDAQVSYPRGLDFDDDGNLYIASFSGKTIRRIDADSGVITTVAGTGSGEVSGMGGPATAAVIDAPSEVHYADGTLYIGSDAYIYALDLGTGIIDVVGGGGDTALSDATDETPATDLDISQVLGIVVDGDDLYFTQIYGTRLGHIDLATGDNVPAAALSLTRGIAIGPDDTLYVTVGHRITILDRVAMTTTTIAGSTLGLGGDGGPAVDAHLNSPKSLIATADGELYFVDAGNHRVRVIRADGTVETVAGTGTDAATAADAPAPPLETDLRGLNSMAIDADGNLFTSEYHGHLLRRLDGGGLAPVVVPYFDDVPESHPFFESIQWMYESGVSTGGPDPDGSGIVYLPQAAVKRQAMAAFLYRLASES